jgi:membrane protease YdiL (CAAX protease family)
MEARVSILRRNRARAGLILFVTFSFLGSWFVAATLRVFELTVDPGTLGTRLFTVSLLYAATMGWQPLVATLMVRGWIDPPDPFDLGIHPTRRIFGAIGVLSAVAFAACATLVAAAAVSLGIDEPRPLNGVAEVELTPGATSTRELFVLPLTFVGAILLVWVQAFAEEIGWRGFFLPRAMRELGRWRGLVAHGVVWGLWYAPVVFFASYRTLHPFTSLARSAGFVATCVLLGVLFGWLRLASKSVMPVVLANATLTLAAGLPYVIHGVDAGLRGAAFGPPGWIVLILAITGLLHSRWRAAVQVPSTLSAATPTPHGVLMQAASLEGTGPNDRRVH